MLLETLKENEKILVTNIFSSAVFGENLRYCYIFRIAVVQKLTFSSISVITEDIYLKFLCVHHPNRNPYYQGRQFKMHFFFFFFSELCPFFDLQKLWHFALSLLLLKVFTWNSDYVFTIQRAIYTIKGDMSKCIFFFFFFFRIMPPFWLTLFILYQTPNSRAFAPWCDALISISKNVFYLIKYRNHHFNHI